MKKDSLFKNYIYNLSSQLLTLLLPMITAPYLARVLLATGNGQVAFVNAIIAYFTSFASFGFSIYGQREIAKNKDNKRKISIIFTDIFILKLLFSVISMILLLLLILSPFINKSYKLLVLINSIQIIAVIFDVSYFYQGIEDFKSLALRTIFIRLVSILCVFIFVKSQNDVWVYILYSALINLLSNIIMWPKTIKYFSIDLFEFSRIKIHLKSSFFIFLPILSCTIYSVIDSTMIGYLSVNPEYENGCYGSAIKLINIISIIIMADGQVLASRNAHDFATGNKNSLFRHIKLGFRYVWIVGIPIIVGQLILADWISLFFFGQGYEKVPLLIQIFTIRVLTHGLMNVIGNQYLLPTGREKVCTIVNFIGIFINILLNLFLIPKAGCIGAAAASVVSESLLVLLYFLFLIKEYSYWDRQMLLQSKNYILSSIIMGLVIILVKNQLEYSIFSLFLLIAIGVIFYFACLIIKRDETFIYYTKRILVDKLRILNKG